LQVEQQVIIPQLRIEADGYKLEQFGLRRNDINDFVETAMQGEIVSQVLDGQRTFDLLVRLDEEYREDIEALKRLVLETPSGGSVKLEDVARIYKAGGPNTVSREQVRRRIVVQCNVRDRGLVDVVEEIKQRLAPIEAKLPVGYFLEYSGQFESQQSASRTIALLFLASLVGIFLVLFTMFHSVNLSLQVMAALPMAFIGAVAALVVTQQTLTVAAMVGFIALVGVASRNGILLLNHYLHLVKYEGEGWTKEMIVRGGLERLAPVLMTALTAGIALIPLTLSAGEPGKEILYPVATVIVGGLISSTLLDFFVHPALFWTMGLGSARRVVEAEEQHISLMYKETFAYPTN
jgi:HME family heavy-metal exporter